MNEKIKLLANTACDKCKRMGFVWARGTCQYCGHKQFDDDFLEKDIKDFSKEFTEEAYKNRKPKFTYTPNESSSFLDSVPDISIVDFDIDD